MPSEAQWEYACRANTTTPFHFGPTITPDLVNYDGNVPYGWEPKGLYRQETTPVGSFPPNAFGLYDMHGNVWEWCADPWHGNYNGAPSDGSSWGTGGDNNRVHRGGSWFDCAVFCRAANRNYFSAGYSNLHRGFRIVEALALQPVAEVEHLHRQAEAIEQRQRKPAATQPVHEEFGANDGLLGLLFFALVLYFIFR